MTRMKLPIPFARHTTYPGHTGVDFPKSSGTLFRASGDGVVTAIGYSARAGHTVWVRYHAEDGSPLVGYVHMNQRTAYVRVGQRVKEGTYLGAVGYTGSGVRPVGPAGAHLHAEVASAATSAGFWKYFDANQVVGQGKPAGGGETSHEEAEMNADERAQMNRIEAKLNAIPAEVWSASVGKGENRRSLASVLTKIEAATADLPSRVWSAAVGRGENRRTMASMLAGLFGARTTEKPVEDAPPVAESAEVTIAADGSAP